MTLRWYVAECRPRQEGLAQSELRNQDFETLLPMFLRRNPRRRQLPVVPLFPGYLLVRFDVMDDGWGAINGTRGIRRLLCSAVGRPAVLPERVAAALVDKFSSGAIPPLEEALEPFRKGRRLRVTDGPFENFEGTCMRSAKSRVVILLSVFGRQMESEFRPAQVEVAA